MCRGMSWSVAVRWCVTGAGACGLERGRFGDVRMWVRREMCRRMSGGRRSSGACRARALVDWSVAGLSTRGCVSGGKCVAASRGQRCSSGACHARALVDRSVAGLLTRGCVSGGKCVAASRGQRCSSGACRARALVDLSVAGLGRCLRVSGRRFVSACRGGRRSGGAWRARTLAGRSVVGSWLQVRKSGGQCVARDESGRQRTQHDMGRQISPARQMNTVVTNRKEIDSSDGWRRRLTVTEKAVQSHVAYRMRSIRMTRLDTKHA
ncbi:hypothetical protein BLA6993_04835 [Burkholderia lata]|nr:hypothetical protein BLA6993_04835 [Burkholderia lata]